MENRLAGATSPYLAQHAHNPVDWYPWGEEALARARAEDKPILLSVGYSACHWCHVMAHESFEDPEVARVMNELFVNVKVDREERPDIDQIYQTAHALLSRRPGGWPLTMFLTPAGAPFFGGTYFPKSSRHGLPGFLELLPKVAHAYREQGDAIAEQSDALAQALVSLEPRGDLAELPVGAPAQALAALERTFDPVYGGFGQAPKFPHPFELAFCLRHAVADANDAARRIVETTLAQMALGGIHDQLGGGFCRYSVDAQWTIPHFEKMLYDNGPLLALYADFARVSRDTAFAAVAHDIAAWMVADLRAPDGAFWSSLDADSEGSEGRYYVWTPHEVRDVLADEEADVAIPYWGLDRPPNFEGHAWNLRVCVPLAQLAASLGIDVEVAAGRLASARRKLYAKRETRVRPGRDEKILTAWNALAIAGLARAARALDAPLFTDLALDAADTLRRTAWRDGRLLATRRADVAALNGYLDDYAFLLAALVELMQTRFRLPDFEWACALADALLAHFEDRERGGFWFTSHDHERLFHRGKPGHDNATPSGNGVAAGALIALGHVAGEPRYVDAAERALRLFAGEVARSASGFPSLLTALEELVAPPTTVVLVGDAEACGQWQRALEQTLRPHVRIFDVSGVDALPARLAKGTMPPGAAAAAWVCRGTQCLPPVDTLAEIEALLDDARPE